MNLNTIVEVKRPASADEISTWREGNAWLAGGTWLFSEPQPALDTLIDLEQLGWPALKALARRPDHRRDLPDRRAGRLRGAAGVDGRCRCSQCCNSFLASFKIWNAATVGGNVCMSLPAGPMISLTAALEGVCTLWPRDGAPRQVSVVDFVTGNHANVLRPGELLRSIHLPRALCAALALRHASLTQLGRSAALFIGTRARSGDLLLTITAATPARCSSASSRALGRGVARSDRHAVPAEAVFRRRARLRPLSSGT